MARIAGIKYTTTPSGKKKSITIDLKRWGQYLEDFLDLIECEAIKNTKDGQEMISLEELKKELEKQHKIKL